MAPCWGFQIGFVACYEQWVSIHQEWLLLVPWRVLPYFLLFPQTSKELPRNHQDYIFRVPSRCMQVDFDSKVMVRTFTPDSWTAFSQVSILLQLYYIDVNN